MTEISRQAIVRGATAGPGSHTEYEGKTMIGAQAVVASLEAEGVDLVFGYPGGQAIKIYDALYDSTKITHVLARHEQGAVHEADGYARATGRVGVAIVTSGPGATNTVTGIATGFYDLDYKTSGLQSSDLILIAARPSMGKTAFVLNLAQNIAIKNKVPTAIFSLEMSKDQLVNRILSMESKVDSQMIRTGNLNTGDWEKLIESAGVISDAPLFIDDTPGITISELRSKCRKYKLEKGLGLVIIDYLQLMNGNRRTESRQQEISDISRALKSLARELDVPVIALSQLSRACEQRPDHRPMLSDLRESGAIEQDADVVMFIYRDDYYNKDTEKKNISEIIIAKQRNGPIGTVELVWLPNYTKFANKSK